MFGLSLCVTRPRRRSNLQDSLYDLQPLRRGRRASSHGHDVRAGYSPWTRGPRRVLPDSPGAHVVHFRLV